MAEYGKIHLDRKILEIQHWIYIQIGFLPKTSYGGTKCPGCCAGSADHLEKLFRITVWTDLDPYQLAKQMISFFVGEAPSCMIWINGCICFHGVL
ncbi:hypothetical protein WT40_15260 [Burkholderia territorii]|nr:hypothetical protein WT40_15260 [Burkholderia territorii]